MQVVTYLHKSFPGWSQHPAAFLVCLFSLAELAVAAACEGDLKMPAELERAFDTALAQVARLLRADVSSANGDSARPQLERLEQELRRERASAVERGTVDCEWFQKMVRWVVEWVPDSELTLVAALGAILRAGPPAV